MQWVMFLLQVAKADLLSNSSLTKELLEKVKTVNGREDLSALEIGCDYVVGFGLPLTLELSLKSLILKEDIEPKHTQFSNLVQSIAESY